jgi:hypothetical protein
VKVLGTLPRRAVCRGGGKASRCSFVLEGCLPLFRFGCARYVWGHPVVMCCHAPPTVQFFERKHEASSHTGSVHRVVGWSHVVGKCSIAEALRGLQCVYCECELFCFCWGGQYPEINSGPVNKPSTPKPTKRTTSKGKARPKADPPTTTKAKRDQLGADQSTMCTETHPLAGQLQTTPVWFEADSTTKCTGAHPRDQTIHERNKIRQTGLVPPHTSLTAER